MTRDEHADKKSYADTRKIFFFDINHNSSDAEDGIIPAFGVNTMPANALAPKVASASAGMVLAGQDRQHVLLFQS